MKHLKSYKIFELKEDDLSDIIYNLKDICQDIEDKGFECKVYSMFDIDKITIKIKPIVEYKDIEEGPKHGWGDFYADDIDISILERLVDYIKMEFLNSKELIRVEFLYGGTFPLNLKTYKLALSEKNPIRGMWSDKLQKNPMRSMDLIIDLNI